MNTKTSFSSRTEEWETPQDFYNKLNNEFHFNLDPCANDQNHKCAKYFTKEQDGLKQDWGGYRVFCNPPYGRSIGEWCKKAYLESKKPETLVVMLIHSRTDTRWFHEWVYGKAELRFVRGRLKFGGSPYNAPFPSVVAIYRHEDEVSE